MGMLVDEPRSLYVMYREDQRGLAKVGVSHKPSGRSKQVKGGAALVFWESDSHPTPFTVEKIVHDRLKEQRQSTREDWFATTCEAAVREVEDAMGHLIERLTVRNMNADVVQFLLKSACKPDGCADRWAERHQILKGDVLTTLRGWFDDPRNEPTSRVAIGPKGTEAIRSGLLRDRDNGLLGEAVQILACAAKRNRKVA
jgi:hypothetical protein